jgi:hypothetical protein
MAKVIDVPWALAAGEDFRYREVKGKKPAGIDLINWYVAKVHRAATRNSVVNRAFLQVMNMLEPPAILFKPTVVFNVIRSSISIPFGLLFSTTPRKVSEPRVNS